MEAPFGSPGLLYLCFESGVEAVLAVNIDVCFQSGEVLIVRWLLDMLFVVIGLSNVAGVSL